MPPENEGSEERQATSTSNGYSREYVSDLRAEAKSWRLKASDFEKQIDSLKTLADTAKADALKAATDLKLAGEERVKAIEIAVTAAKADAEVTVSKVRAEAGEAATSASKAFNDRLVRAEIKAGAIAAGISHQDYVSLLDTSAVKVDDKGDVVIPATFWDDAKKAKAHLFTRTGADAGKTTSTSTTPPPADPGAKRHVSQLSKEEMAAAQSRIKAGLSPFSE
jgi:hypothetical protein